MFNDILVSRSILLPEYVTPVVKDYDLSVESRQEFMTPNWQSECLTMDWTSKTLSPNSRLSADKRTSRLQFLSVSLITNYLT